MAVIFAVFLPILIGMVAMSMEIGMMTTAKAQMATSADAAALAGARQLFTDNRLVFNTSLTTEIAAAQTSATSIAQQNRILNAAPILVANTNNISTGEIVVGYMDPSSTTSTINTSGSQSSFNAVQVRITRDATHGGIVPALFSNVNGYNGRSLSITSVATAQNYAVGGFSSVNGLNANLLPIALDLTTYNAMIAGNPSKRTTTGLPTDQYTYDPTGCQTVTSGPDGIYESCLYPVSNGSPGNWGTVNIGVSNNGTSTLGAQIQYGITPAQLATYPGGVIQLSKLTTPPSLQLGANPGISAGVKSDIDAIIGQTRFMPIYSSVTGNGNNTTYTIVKFAGVRVMASNFQGNPKYVVVQPALVTDPTAIPSTPESSWMSGGLISIHLAR